MRPLFARVLIVLALLSLAQAHADSAAQDKTAPNERPKQPTAVQELRKISVTATRGAREVDSVAGTVTLIDDEQIEAQMATDIKELIRYEPGISVANSAARFGLAGFNIRGIEGNRVLMRVDGVPAADAFAIGSFSDARRNLIDLDAVKSVEIIRGPASALYGSDAIGGVVSFIMKEPADYLRDGRSTDMAVKSGYQSDDDGWYSGGRFAFGSDTLSGLVLYTHREGHETDNQGDVGTTNFARTKPNPQQYDSDSVLAKLGWQLDDNHDLRLTAQLDRDDVDTNVLSGLGAQLFPPGIDVQSLTGDDRQERARVSLGYEWFADATMFDSLDWLLYVQDTEVEQRTQEQRYTIRLGPPSTVHRNRVFTFEQSVLGAEVVLHKDVVLGGSEHLLTYGLDVTRTDTEQLRNGVQTNLATGAQTSNILPDDLPVRDFPKTQTWEYGLYAQDEISLGEDWMIIPGVRVDRYELDPEPDAIFVADNPGVTTTGIEETSVTPKLGVIRAFGPHYSAFAQYARGFRAPPYNDVNIGFTNFAFGYTAIANPDLKPETSNGYELGLRGEFDRGYFALTGFYNDYDDLIESFVNVGVRNGLLVFQSQNVAEARIYGAEFRGALDLSTLAQGLSGWTVKSSIAWARGDNRVTDRPLNSVDPLKGVLGIAYAPQAGHWGIELAGTAVDRKSHVDDGSAEQFIPAGYVTLDLLFHADIGERLRINAGVFNLTDRKYWEWSDVRGRSAGDLAIDRYTRPGLNASASATIRF